MNEWELYGYIRQEENKYYLRNLAGEEGLAYDFDATIGDTIQINNPFGVMPVDAVVTNIDSVHISPGNELRKRISLYDFQYYFNMEFWIEGMGSFAGLTESGMDMTLTTGGDDYTLLCYYEKGELIFKWPFYALCYYPIVRIPQISDGEINFYFNPNPVKETSRLIIKNQDNKTYYIKIINNFGQVLRKYDFPAVGEMEIKSEDFSAGIYFYSIFEENEFIYCGKLIIQ